MAKAGTIKEAIARLKKYDQNELIAVNWWTSGDFPDLTDKEQAIDLAQDYLDNLSPELTEYVDMEYEDDEEESD